MVVASKAKTVMTQDMKNKPTKCRMKIFVLTESSNSYTVDFNVHTGKTQTPSHHGLSYNTVLELIKPSYLGTGYHIYMDNFWTNLFTVLSCMKFGAFGTYRENRQGYPRDRANALNRKSQRREIRWIREGLLLFVKLPQQMHTS